MDKDVSVVFKLTCLVSNNKREIVGSLDIFLSFLRKYEKEKKLTTCFP
jgi:hypothetical protein